MEWAEGGCHCGAVRYRVALTHASVVSCNCSICRAKGILHYIVEPGRFELVAGTEALTTYQFGTMQARHSFCKHCGVQPFYAPRSHPNHVDVNVNTLDTPRSFRIRAFDGANWEAARSDLDQDPLTQVRGYYGIVDGEDLTLAEALLPQTRVLQLRNKERDGAWLLTKARALQAMAHASGALFIVNDRVDVALAASADGVHLGQTDMSLCDARRIAPALLIGISTHDRAQAQRAWEGGADYIGFGPVFSTATKANPDPIVGCVALSTVVQEAAGPVVAIGGITRRTIDNVVATGAAAAAVISDVNGAPDPGAAAMEIKEAFRRKNA